MTNKFNPITIALHWLVVLLVATAYITAAFNEWLPQGLISASLLRVIHYSAGISILTLVLPRIIALVVTPIPAIVPPPPKTQALLAQLMKMALYAFMVLMPLVGWLSVNAEGETVTLIGNVQLPILIAENDNLAELLEEVHEAGAFAGLFLIGLHSAAALFHHYIQRDNTLRRMLPWQPKP